MLKKSGLGRGLDSLIPQVKVETEPMPGSGIDKLESQLVHLAISEGHVIKIPLNSIVANQFQPREDFDQEKLNELVESIKEKGIIQPVLVRKKGEANSEAYELIAGERRFRAAKKAGLTEIPAIVRDANNEESLELALIENIQRSNLNPMEEAKAYRKLMESFGLNQDELSKKVGKERSTVANTLRLLKLPEEIQKAITEEKITYGHGRALLGLTTEVEQLMVYGKIILKNLSVRDTEQIVQKANRQGGIRLKPIVEKSKDPFLFQYEESLKRFFGTQVKINTRGKGGHIEIEYYSKDDLVRIIECFPGSTTNVS
ncbi:MAG: ParB/RepB/Spo0J family partition protein [bacterium]